MLSAEWTQDETKKYDSVALVNFSDKISSRVSFLFQFTVEDDVSVSGGGGVEWDQPTLQA